MSITAAHVTGHHPYADAWPMLSEEDLAELAADIKVNGLREPVILYDDKILDGRNRYAACKSLDIEPIPATTFDGDDDEALAFVQSANNARRHQSKGSLAASWALSMLAAGKRSGGRWEYRALTESGQSRQRLTELGLIADHAPDLLTQVRDDDLSLNAAHQKAEDARDAEQNRLAREAAEAQEEADAEEFIRKNAPDLAEQVEDAGWTWTAARTEWERRNREAAEELRKKKAEKQRVENERLSGIKRDANRVLNFLDGLSAAANLGQHPYRAEVLEELPPHHRNRILRIEKEATWPTTL